MKLFQYDLLRLLKLKPMGTPQVIQFCVLISAQLNWVREVLLEKQTYVCDFKLNRNQDSASFSDAKSSERDRSFAVGDNSASGEGDPSNFL